MFSFKFPTMDYSSWSQKIELDDLDMHVHQVRWLTAPVNVPLVMKTINTLHRTTL